MQPAARLFTLVAVSLLPGLCSHCTPPDSLLAPPTPPLSLLPGRWHYDSVGVTFYEVGQKPTHQLLNVFPPTSYLTIQSDRLIHSGPFREVHTYILHGNRLFAQRLVDSAVVRAQQAEWKDLGNVIGNPDTLRITLLTAHRLVLCDSSAAPQNPSLGVWRYYHSR